jgi:hypothetical protein
MAGGEAAEGGVVDERIDEETPLRTDDGSVGPSSFPNPARVSAFVSAAPRQWLVPVEPWPLSHSYYSLVIENPYVRDISHISNAVCVFLRLLSPR